MVELPFFLPIADPGYILSKGNGCRGGRMRRITAFWLAGISSAALGQAAPPAPNAQGDVSVTIYDTLALVEDTRTLDLPAGTIKQEFRDVSAAIRPETVTLEGDAIEIVEQNFDYDLLSPAQLMAKAEGQEITIIRRNPATGVESTEKAKVLAVNGGVVMEVNGKIEVLRDDGQPVRVIFDSIPPNLRARPTLSVTLDSAKASRRPVTLSYLSNGLGWNADYVGLFDEEKQTMDFQGWVTLTNSSGTAFPNAQLTLAAGDVVKLNQQKQKQYRNNYNNQYGGNGTEDGGEDKVGDLYLYPIDGRTTIATAQKKQVSFIDTSGVAAKRGYLFTCNWLCRSEEPMSAESIIDFSTGKKGGLGNALPAGVVRVYMRDKGGKARFVGESKIEHTPAGSDVKMATGYAFDVKVKPIIESRESITEDKWKATAQYKIVSDAGEQIVTVNQQRRYQQTKMRYIVSNARNVPVVVTLVQTGLMGWSNGTRITDESIKGEQRDASARVWQVPVPANGKTEVTVTVLTDY
jgi:hypothetical protein